MCAAICLARVHKNLALEERQAAQCAGMSPRRGRVFTRDGSDAMRFMIGALTLGALAGSVQAQCDATRYGIPDFDQRRAYLAGDGAMYCVPTAVLNLMGYIANHGQPQALKHSSSNWAAMSE